MNANVDPKSVAVPPEPKMRTITLTNRAPIQIDETEWPVIAQGTCGWEHPGFCAGWNIEFRVRHGKWKTIIHANYASWEEDREDNDQKVRVGRVITNHEAASDLWKHMLEVGEELRSRIAAERLKKHVVYALDECFANLKPLAA
jgi:hypothetical protein